MLIKMKYLGKLYEFDSITIKKSDNSEITIYPNHITLITNGKIKHFYVNNELKTLETKDSVFYFNKNELFII